MTYTRPKGTQYGVDALSIRCDEHSEFDANGFALKRATDPPGDRCWWPGTFGACTDPRHSVGD